MSYPSKLPEISCGIDTKGVGGGLYHRIPTLLCAKRVVVAPFNEGGHASSVNKAIIEP